MKRTTDGTEHCQGHAADFQHTSLAKDSEEKATEVSPHLSFSVLRRSLSVLSFVVHNSDCAAVPTYYLKRQHWQKHSVAQTRQRQHAAVHQQRKQRYLLPALTVVSA